jgi:VCBS repeat-containing protein
MQLFGGVGFAVGLFGQALDMNRNSAQYAARPVSDPVFNFGTSSFTVQEWVNFDTTAGEQVLIEKFDGGGGPGWTFTKLDGNTLRVAGVSVSDTPALTIPTNVWHQFLLRKNGSQFDVYFNGISVRSTTNAGGAIANASRPLLIGKRNDGDGRNFAVDGRIDEVAIWDRALSDAEIATLYNGGAGTSLALCGSCADAYSVNEDGTLTVDAATGVLANDGPQFGEALSASVVTGPAHGTLTLDADGSFTYTPAANYFGGDSFVYRITSNQRDPRDAGVTITVNSAPDLPIAVDDLYRTREGQVLNVDPPPTNPVDTPLVTLGSEWRYLDNGNDQGTAWRAPEFDDSSWSSGRAQFGYGEGDEATVVSFGPNPNSKYTTTYFRRTFVLPDPPLVSSMFLSVLRDDGVVVYINGVEVGRNNMPGGNILFNTPSSSALGGQQESTPVTFNVSAAQIAGLNLVAGENTIAVEIHQDASGSTSDLSFDLRLNGMVSPPPAVAGVLANDVDPDGGTLTAVVDSLPDFGTLTLNPNGTFVYTPSPGFNGTDSFTYRARNATGDSPAATVEIIVIPASNTPPTPTPDAYSVDEDGELTIAAAGGVLANDTDAQGNPLSAVLVTPAAHGELTLAADGSFTYRPSENFNGTDTFTYSADDGFEVSQPATVTISVAGTPDAPVAVDDAYTAESGIPLVATTPVVVDPTPRDEILILPRADWDYFHPTNGQDPAASDPDFNTTWQMGGAAYNGPAFTPGTAIFGYGTIECCAITTDIGTPPEGSRYTAYFRRTFELTEDPATVTALIAVVLADDGAAIYLNGQRVGAVNMPPGSDATYFTLTGTVGNETDTTFVTLDPTALVAGTNVVAVSVHNTEPSSTDLGFDLRLNAQITPRPEVAGVLANDTDADGDSLFVELVAPPAHGELTLNPDGTFTYTSDTGFIGEDTFQYRASDDDLPSNTATVRINVIPAANRPPDAVDDAYSVDEDAVLTLDAAGGVLANDSDFEGHPFTAVVVAQPQHGTLAFSADGSFTYTPNTNFSGADAFTYQATDTYDDSRVATVAITVRPVADAPVAVDDAFETDEGQTLADGEAIALFWGDELNDAIQRTNLADGATQVVSATQNSPRNVAIDQSGGKIYWTTISTASSGTIQRANLDGSGAQTLVTSSGLLTGLAVDSVAGKLYWSDFGARWIRRANLDGSQVENVVQLPLAENISAIVVDALGGKLYWADDRRVIIRANLNGTNVETIVDVQNTPSQLALDPRNGKIYWPEPNGRVLRANLNGTSAEEILMGLTDPRGIAVDSVGGKVYVSEYQGGRIRRANLDGTQLDDVVTGVSNPRNLALQFREANVLTNDFDADGDVLTAVLISDVANGTLDLNDDGTFTYTPDPGFIGVDSFTYVANDDGLDSNVATVTITVRDVNVPPVAIDDAYAVDEDATLVIDAASGILANDSDFEGATLSAVLADPPQSGTVNLAADGSFTYTPDADYFGTDTFTYRARDNEGDSPLAGVTITINPVPDAPVAVDDAYSAESGVTLVVDGTAPPPASLFFDDFESGTLSGNWTFSNSGLDVTGGRVRATENLRNLTTIEQFSGNLRIEFDIERTGNQNHGCWDLGFGIHGRIGVLRFGTEGPDTIAIGGNTNALCGGGEPTVSTNGVDRGHVTLVYSGGVMELTFTNTDGATISTQSTYTDDGLLHPLTIEMAAFPNAPRFIDNVEVFAVGPGEIGTLFALVPFNSTWDYLHPLNGQDPASADADFNTTWQLGGASYNGPAFTSGTALFGYGSIDCCPIATDIGTPQQGNRYTAYFRRSFELTADPSDVSSLTAEILADDGAVIYLNGQRVTQLNMTSNGGYFDQSDATGSENQTSSLPLPPPVLVRGTNVLAVSVHNVDPSFSTDLGFDLRLDARITPEPELAGVLANDTDAEGDTLFVELVTPPASGELTLNPDGTFEYTSDVGFVGVDTFQYRASDDDLPSNVATVRITVAPAMNRAPVAVNDAYAVDEGTVLTVDAASGVLSNDSDPDQHPITATLVAQPQHGALTFNADGSFEYTPAAGYFGADAFTYRASDGFADSAIATVAITVRPGASDFGDAPLPYPTTVAEDGAIHRAVGPMLGAARDSEGDGVHSAAADGDGADDGVTFGEIRVGQVDASVMVEVGNAPAGARIDAWIDWNGDGAWGGPFERIAASAAVVNGSNTLRFEAPSWAIDGQVFARFRLSTAGNLGVSGSALDGEVEDYAVTVTPPVATDGIFGDPSTISAAANGANSVFAADMDGDGDLDVLSASRFDDRIVWYENNGDAGAPAFTERTISTNANAAIKVIAEDVDGDGDMDVISASVYDARIAWYENDGSQMFTARTISTGGIPAQGVFAADVDGDGDMDVLSASAYDGRIAWYENDGSETFTARTISTAVPGAVDVFAADVDGDGDMDALSASVYDSRIAWYENNGSQTFTARTISTAAQGAQDVFAADVDGDGDMDVLSASYSDDTVAWYENNGSQTFTERNISAVADGAVSVFAADIDGDGDVDALSASYSDSSIAWHENDGAQSFTERTVGTAGVGALSVFAADVDGDGDLDALSASRAGEIAWYENQSPLCASCADDYSVDEDAVLVVDVAAGVLVNDEPQEGETLTASLLSPPSHGTVTLAGDGSFEYTPDANYSGIDTFTYEASSNQQIPKSARVTITINPVPDAPVAVDDAYTAESGVTLRVTSPVIVDPTPRDETLVPFNSSWSYMHPTNGQDPAASDPDFTTTWQLGGAAYDGPEFNAGGPAILGYGAINYGPVQTDIGLPPEGSRYTAYFRRTFDLTVDPSDVTGLTFEMLADDGAVIYLNGQRVAIHNMVFGATGAYFDLAQSFNIPGGQTEDVTVVGILDPAALVAGTNVIAVSVHNITNDSSDSGFDLRLDARIVPEPEIAGVLANDTDAEGDTLFVELITPPANGELTLNADGTFEYTSDVGFVGVDTFQYRASDDDLPSNVATVTIAVAPAMNQPPEAVDDDYAVDEDAVLTIDAAGGVLANDSDPEQRPITAALIAAPQHGSVSFNADGSFVYTPVADYFGADTFTYRANDGFLDSPPATVTITVRGVPDAPIARDDAYTVDQGLTLVVDEPGSVYDQAVLDDSPIGYWRLGESAGPTAVDETGVHNGVYSGAIDFGLPGALANDANTSVELDGLGGVATVPHNPALNPAMLTVEAWIRVDSSASIFDAVLTKSSDGNWADGYGLFYSGDGEIVFFVNNYFSGAVSAPIVFDQWHHVVGTYDANVASIYLDGALVSTLQLGEPIAHVSANLLLLQGEGAGSPIWTWTGGLDEIAIYGTALSAERVMAHYLAGVAATGGQLGVLGNDRDADGDTLNVALVDGPDHGQLSLNPDGTFTYTAEAEFLGTDSFTYRANDGTSDSNVATVTINVRDVNSVPSVQNDDYAVDEDGTLTIDALAGVLANDMDVEMTPLTAAVASAPANGTLALAEDGSFVYTPNANFFGTDTFTYRASDGVNNSPPALVTITVRSVNDLPVAMDDAYEVNEDTQLVVASGPAVDVTLIPLGATWRYLDDGSDQGTAWRGPSFDDSSWASGAAELGYGDGDETTTVNCGPTDPACFGSNFITTYFRTTFTIDDASRLVGNLRGNFRRDDGIAVYINGIEVARSNLAPNALFSTPANNNANDDGDTLFPFTAALDLIESGENYIAVEIHQFTTNSSDISFDLELIAQQQPIVGVLVNDTDADGETLVAQVATGPEHGTLMLNADGTFTYMPDRDFFGTDQFSYRASDGTAVSAPATVTIQVHESNLVPVAANDAFTIAEDAALVVDLPGGLLANDTDGDGDPIAAELVTLPLHGTLALFSNGTFKYVPALNYNGTDSFTYLISDGRTESNPSTVNITVTPINDPPAPREDVYAINADETFTNAEPAAVFWGDGTTGRIHRNDLDGSPTANIAAAIGLRYVTVEQASGKIYWTHAGFLGAGQPPMIERANLDGSNRQPLINLTNESPSVAVDTSAGKMYWANNAAGTIIRGNLDGTNIDEVVSIPGMSTFALALDVRNGKIYWSTASPTTAIYRANLNGADVQIIMETAAPETGAGPIALDVSAGKIYWSHIIPNVDDPIRRANLDGSNTETLLMVPNAISLALDSVGNKIYLGDSETRVIQRANLDGTGSQTVLTSVDASRGLGLILDGGVLANDLDVDGDTTSASVVAGPFHGTLDFNDDGSFTYTPNTGFTGVDQFSYVARDASSASAPTRVTINVGGVNLPPTAAHDRYRVTRGQPLVVDAVAGVLANDSDPNGDALSARISASPANGTLVLNADGSFTYTPGDDFTGMDVFQYTVGDGQAQTTPTTVVLNVRLPVDPINSVPQAVLDRYQMPFDASISVSPEGGVLANDMDAEQQPLVATLVVPPRHGTLELGFGGYFRYEPLPGFHGTDSFTYRADDGNTAAAPAMVLLEVLPPGAAQSETTDWLYGDANRDGLVNAADLTFVLRHQFTRLGMAAYDPAADINGDGRVNIRDAVLLRNQLAAPPSAGAIVRTSLVANAVDAVLTASDDRQRLRARRNVAESIAPATTDVDAAVLSVSKRPSRAAIRGRRA